MPQKLRIKFRPRPSITINRSAFRATKLVYVVRANKEFRYPWGRSRIGYIGTTKVGAGRVATSAVAKGEELLGRYGIKHLDLHIVTCGRLAGVETWLKLERALIIRFRESFGRVPQANSVGKLMRWRDEKRYFSEQKLDKIIDGLG